MTASMTESTQDYVEVGYEVLDHDRAVDLVTHESAGAISTFIGTTRDNFNGKKVVRLEYEGYIPMAKLELLKICAHIREQWPSVVGIAMFHRLGVVEVRQASVVIAISSPHRREAIEACAYGIDTLKATVPIWKSEQYEGDSRMWKENVEWENGAVVRHSCCGAKRVMAPAKGQVILDLRKVAVAELRLTPRHTKSKQQMGGEIEPRRLALRYEPPAIVVEYARRQSYRLQLYHHEIDVGRLLPFSKTTSVTDWEVSEMVDKIMQQHASVLEDVSSLQLKRLVKKLINQIQSSASSSTPSTAMPDPGPVAAPLPQADYNRVSETQLRHAKEKMDVVFQQKLLRPGDKGYQYDKQVSFTPSEEASDWDD